MKLAIALIVLLALVMAWVFRKEILAFVKALAARFAPKVDAVHVQSAQTPPAASQAATAAQGPVVVNPDGSRTSSNPILDGYLHSNTAYVAPSTDVAVDPNAPDFVNGREFDVKWAGANVIFTGTQTKTITGVKGKLRIDTNQKPNTQPYALSVNGVSKDQPMVAATLSIETEPDAQGNVLVTVSQPADSSVVMAWRVL